MAEHDQKAHDNADDGGPGQKLGGRKVLHEPGKDEAGDDEDRDGNNLPVAGNGFADTEFPHSQANGEGPGAALRAHVEEEGQNAEDELPVFNEPAVSGKEAVPVGVGAFRHLDDQHGDQNGNQNETHRHVSPGNGGKLAGLDGHKLSLAHGSAGRGVGFVKVGKNEEAAQKHARHGSQGVESLGNVKTPVGSLHRAHGKDVGVGGRFQDGAAAGQDVDGDQIEFVGSRLGSREEKHRAGRIDRQA